MLTELHIRNFAIIDQLDLDLEPGLIIFTGETGAGKSIIMDALDILMGGRTDATSIRSEAEQAHVEGTFKLSGPERPAAHAILEREELLDDPDYVTLTREIRREGRNVGRVNGRSVGISLLKELGELLVDIHGQSEHLSLLNVRAHLGLLDRYAGVESELAAYHKVHQNLAGLRRELQELQEAQNDAERRTEMLNFQAGEIEAAKLKDGEDTQLKQERDRLANAENLATLAQEALTALDEGTPESPATTDLFGQAARALAKLAQIDPTQKALAEQSTTLEETLADLARSLRDYQEAIEYNPQRLEELEERLDLIHRLERKYGGSIASSYFLRRRCPHTAGEPHQRFDPHRRTGNRRGGRIGSPGRPGTGAFKKKESSRRKNGPGHRDRTGRPAHGLRPFRGRFPDPGRPKRLAAAGRHAGCLRREWPG